MNVTCYTLEQLLRICRRGGLFGRHLIEEAIPLTDPQDMLGALKSAYVPTVNYQAVKKEVCACAPLLDVTESTFNGNAEGLSSLATYLIRTYLYATAFDLGARSFSMGHILDLLGQSQASATLSNLRLEPNFRGFEAVRTLFEDITGTTCQMDEGSLEAFIVNAGANNELAMILGIRLLARGRPFTYDVIRDLEL